jgi:hypothetical protein
MYRASTLTWLMLGAAASFTLACSGGGLDSGAAPSDVPSGTAGTGPDVTAAGGNAGTTPIGGGAGGTIAQGGNAPLPEAPLEPGVDPGTKGPHRLNDVEYNSTLQDLFADPTIDLARGWLPGEAAGFDNIASQLHMNDATYDKYFGAAATVADGVFARADQLAQIVTCQDATPTCAQSIIESLGLRVWRRPLEANEVTNLVTVYTTATTAGEDHNGALELVLRAMLSSPQFLYRIEFDADPASTVKHEVTGYELASRLSYFLWSSTPDATLLAAAGAGTLSDPAALSATVGRMLSDAKVSRLARNFSGQWLGIRKVPGHVAFPNQFPTWSPELAASMAEEAYIYFAQFLQGNVPWSDFVRADMNFVDQTLATFYGMPAPANAGFNGVVVTDDQRVGFFGLGAFLAASSFPQRTSPTLRAKHILEDILCTPPPEPPPDVAAAVDAMQAEAEANMGDEVTDIRAFLDAHRTQPDCAACHSIFDPYGMALENFDGIGQWRTQYPNGAPIDPTATLLNGTQLNGLADVVNAVSADPKLSSCVADKMFTYGLGRVIEPTDKPYIAEAVHAWLTQGTDLTLRGLAQALVATEPFRMRRAAVAN